MYEWYVMFHVKHWYAFTSIDEWVVAIAAVVGLLVDRCTSDAAWWCGAVWGGVLDVGNVSRETKVRICVDDTA